MQIVLRRVNVTPIRKYEQNTDARSGWIFFLTLITTNNSVAFYAEQSIAAKEMNSKEMSKLYLYLRE